VIILHVVATRLHDIRRKRDELLLSDRAPIKFGSHWQEWLEHHRKWSRANDAAVSQFEHRHGVTLPVDYRQFVTNVADGGIGPGCGMFSLAEASADAPEFTGALSAPFPYGNVDAQKALTKRAHGVPQFSLAQPNDDGLPGGCLLLAHTGSGCFDVLVITGEQRGTIWFHDSQRLFPIGFGTKPLEFFDWYESWLDGWISSLKL